jgi:hypothetical protein
MDNKGNPADTMNVKNEIERLAFELSSKKGKPNGADLESWLEAERIVTEWLKDRGEAEDAKDTQKKEPGT